MFEIGNSLRAARERKELSYAEIEQATKIRSRYIRALEEEDFTVLPSDTYIRGFLRTYADYLGLDGEVYVEEYASRFLTSWRDDLPAPGPRRGSRERTVERRAVLLALAGIGVVTALVFAAWRYGGSSTRVPGLGTTGSQAPAAPQLVLTGRGRGTYVEVRQGGVHGRVVFQATVPPGGVEKLSGLSFYLVVRRPKYLRVTLGGHSMALPAHANAHLAVAAHWTTRSAG